MTGEERCRCGHANGDHTVTGECAIERFPSREGFIEAKRGGYDPKMPCGCEQFSER